MNNIIGTDTFGRVKAVGQTTIVTVFATLYHLPIYPLQSFYLSSTSSSNAAKMPFIKRFQTMGIHGVALVHVDRQSTVMTYVRAVFAAMVVVGLLTAFPIVVIFTGERLSGFAMFVTLSLGVCFISGVVGLVLTYVSPLITDREKSIRQKCGELLCICIDPAKIPADAAAEIEHYLAEKTSEANLGASSTALIQELISCRSKIAQGIDSTQMECRTDEILARLNPS